MVISCYNISLCYYWGKYANNSISSYKHMWVYNYLNKIINNKTSSHRVGKLYLELIKDLYCEYTSNIFTKNKRTKQLQIKKPIP